MLNNSEMKSWFLVILAIISASCTKQRVEKLVFLNDILLDSIEFKEFYFSDKEICKVPISQLNGFEVMNPDNRKMTELNSFTAYVSYHLKENDVKHIENQLKENMNIDFELLKDYDFTMVNCSNLNMYETNNASLPVFNSSKNKAYLILRFRSEKIELVFFKNKNKWDSYEIISTTVE
jgi:hypothetical protein